MNILGFDIAIPDAPDIPGALACFDPSYHESPDLGPPGMISEMQAFLRITKDMKRFLDVGALFGIFSLMFTRRPGTVAYAIEPSPLAFSVLVEICRLNPINNIHEIQMFAGEKIRDVTCYKSWRHVVAGRESEYESCLMREQPIDSLRLRRVDCMKIDVEGYEVQVLRGSRETIKRSKPVIFLECHFADLHRHGESAESLKAILDELEYRVEDLNGEPDTSFGNCDFTRVVCRPR